MNAANEVAVEAFIGERIKFSEIPKIIEFVMDDHQASDAKDLTAVLNADREARASSLESNHQIDRQDRSECWLITTVVFRLNSFESAV